MFIVPPVIRLEPVVGGVKLEPIELPLTEIVAAAGACMQRGEKSDGVTISSGDSCSSFPK